ncbi:hypothetical protein [Polyangium jinanense]|uniref:Uncharacterized protein n=1 Tax=Polyangium jinanense TaxID=2829994 RepID=A0A9X3XCH6_9BACT|nr:hypothetical protein [Polyangium jinanense]MDC3960534.1 hypothetical protein [Polyangium jinanense]MDC3985396.1 hypothetical protein [Polyangium jinanense]
MEAGPTVLAGGFEKDLALVVAPSVTIPCQPPNPDAKLPPLVNVATLQPGPFTVTVPIVGTYDELAKAARGRVRRAWGQTVPTVADIENDMNCRCIWC